MPLRKLFDKLLLPLLTAAVIALAGWVYTTGARVAALEAQREPMEESIRVIRQDVREIRNWVVPTHKQ